MPFTCANAKAIRARSHGLHRAAFWRDLGFPDLVLARARPAELRAQRKQMAQTIEAAKAKPRVKHGPLQGV